MMKIRQFSAYAWLAVALLSGICYGSSYTRLSHLDCNRANASTLSSINNFTASAGRSVLK